MASIREDRDIFRIIPAGRQAEAHRQKACLLISLIHCHRIVSCIAAENMFLIRREMHGTSGCQRIRPTVCRGNRLELLKNRRPVTLVIGKHFNHIFKLIEDIQKPSVRAEHKISGRGLSLTADRIQYGDLAFLLIKPVNLDLINSQVSCHQKLLIGSQAAAAHVRPEIPLCHAAEALVVYAVRNPPDGAVLIDLHHGFLPVMVAGHEYVIVVPARREMMAAHPLDVGTV